MPPSSEGLTEDPKRTGPTSSGALLAAAPNATMPTNTATSTTQASTKWAATRPRAREPMSEGDTMTSGYYGNAPVPAPSMGSDPASSLAASPTGGVWPPWQPAHWFMR